jgi:hypothetical protein
MAYLKLDGNVVHSSWNDKVYVQDISGSTGFTETNKEFKESEKIEDDELAYCVAI